MFRRQFYADPEYQIIVDAPEAKYQAEDILTDDGKTILSHHVFPIKRYPEVIFKDENGVLWRTNKAEDRARFEALVREHGKETG